MGSGDIIGADSGRDHGSLLMSKRECGSCSLCCKVLDVPAIYKPAGQWCRHFRAGSGCDIHQLRPKPCREFSCLWLAEDWLGDEWKPSQSKFVMAWEYEGECLTVYPDPKAPNSWKLEPYYPVLKKLAARHLSENRLVMVVETSRRLLVLPDQDVVVGTRGDIFEWQITPKDDGSGQFDVVFDPVSDGRKGGATRFDQSPSQPQASSDSFSFN
jgi:hypothetical protein